MIVANQEARTAHEFVMMIDAARRICELSGKKTSFRRMDHEGRTHFLYVGYENELQVITNQTEIETSIIPDHAAVLLLQTGEWECLK